MSNKHHRNISLQQSCVQHACIVCFRGVAGAGLVMCNARYFVDFVVWLNCSANRRSLLVVLIISAIFSPCALSAIIGHICWIAQIHHRYLWISQPLCCIA